MDLYKLSINCKPMLIIFGALYAEGHSFWMYA